MPQITGNFLKSLNKVEGENDGRPWVRIQFGIMTTGDSSRLVAFDAFGEDRVAAVEGLSVGTTIVVEYSPESREYGNKFFTNLKCHRILRAQNMQQGETWETR